MLRPIRIEEKNAANNLVIQEAVKAEIQEQARLLETDIERIDLELVERHMVPSRFEDPILHALLKMKPRHYDYASHAVESTEAFKKLRGAGESKKLHIAVQALPVWLGEVAMGGYQPSYSPRMVMTFSMAPIIPSRDPFMDCVSENHYKPTGLHEINRGPVIACERVMIPRPYSIRRLWYRMISPRVPQTA